MNTFYLLLAIQSRRLRRRTSLRGLPAAARFARLGSLRSQEASLFCKRGSLRSQKNLIWNTFYFGFYGKRGSLRSQKNLIWNTFCFWFLWQTWLASLAKESNSKNLLIFVSVTIVARFARIFNTFCFWFLWQTWLALLAKESYLQHLFLFLSFDPPKSRSVINFEVLSWPQKMLPSMFFDTPNSKCEVTASEAAEAGLIVTMTWPTLSTTHMQSFNLLALKLRPCIDNTGKYRRLLWLRIYIVRF